MLLGVGGSAVAGFLFFGMGWGGFGIVSLIVAALSFWGFGVAANFREDPHNMPNAAAFFAMISRPVAIVLLVVALAGTFF